MYVTRYWCARQCYSLFGRFLPKLGPLRGPLFFLAPFLGDIALSLWCFLAHHVDELRVFLKKGQEILSF